MADIGIELERPSIPWIWRSAGGRWVVAATVIVALGSCALIPLRPAYDQLADLKVYWGAIRQVMDGRPLYEFRAANGDPFTYPPFAEVLLAPTGRLPFPILGAFWTVTSVVAIVALGWFVAHRALSIPVERRTTASWLVALGLLLSAPGQSDLRFGQISLLLVLACFVDGLGLVPPRFRGVLIGLAAAVKLTPLLFVVHLLVTGRRQDALRALGAFTAATAVGFVVLPRDSWTYWTSAIFATDRIGDIAALGNQSVNGLLLRAGVPTAFRPALWAVVVALLVLSALVRARALHRQGQGAAGVVLVGCATLAASPVSWTHHQFWTVLAAMLLVGGGVGLRRAAGWALLATMVVDLTDLVARAHLGDHALLLVANARVLAVCVLCVAGLSVTARRPARASVPRARVLVGATTTAVVGSMLFLLIPVPSTQDPAIRPLAADSAVQRALSGGPPCATEGLTGCTFIPMWPDLTINYGDAITGSGAEISGFVSPAVARLTYAPAPGADAVDVPLGRLNLPSGVQAFELRAGETSFAQLKAYDASGAFLGEFGNKLRN